MPLRPSRLALEVPELPLGETDVPGVDRIIALANNENVSGPTPHVLAACANASLSANWYPDVSACALRESIAVRYEGVIAENVVVGVGAGELIGLLGQSYCEPGTEVVVSEHGYAYFAIAAKAYGAKPVAARAARGANSLSLDPQAIANSVTENTRVVFIDNPGNPLGTHLGRDAIGELRNALPDNVLLVLDCAYGDYVTASDYSFGHELVTSTNNTVVVCTFSKIYGLAGLRVGWIHAPPEVAALVRRVQRPGNVSSVSLAAALAALDEPDLMAARCQQNAAVRDTFSRVLTDELGLGVNPSQTNFVLVTVPPGRALTATQLLEQLQAQGILIRAMGPYGFPDGLRISIGTAQQMSEVADAIRALLT
jgi:histidinol-phosphate aminotransferase